MLTKVIDEQPFQVLTDSFSISPSTTGYELEISADGINYSPLFAVAANTTRLVTNVANGSYYRLKNNSGEVVVNWRTTCKSSGGGGGEGSQGPQGPMGPQGYQGPAGGGSVDLSEYWTSAETQTAIQNEAQQIVGYVDELQEQTIAAIPEAVSQLINDEEYVSSGNLKTINNESIVGTGNISIQGGDSHILKASSSAPSGLSEGDVYALHADGSPREIGLDWTDTGEVSYEWSEDYPQAVSIPLNNSEYYSVRIAYTDGDWGGDRGFYVENGELHVDDESEWESDGENSYKMYSEDWAERTSGATVHAFFENDTLYFYSDDVNRIWLRAVVEPSDEDHTISTGEITPAVPETMGVYQYNDGTVVELASKDDLPAKINLVPNGEANYGLILRYNQKPEWVHPSDITNAQLINIETDSEAEDTYPTILKRTSSGDFRWALPEKRLEAVSALPTTYVEGAVYALANASGYGVYQVQSGTSDMTWVHFNANIETIPTGWTQARVPYNDDGESNLVGLHINNCDDEVNLYWHPEDAENKFWDGVDGEQNDGEFEMTDSCGNSISCVRNGDYLVLTFSAPVVHVGETWNHTELYVEGIVPNYKGVVMSNAITNIWRGTQAEYNALSPNYDNNTFYIII